MNKLKYALGSGATSVALALGVAMPVAAQQTTDCSSGAVSSNVCPNVSVDNSQTTTLTLGNCSAVIRNNVTQEQTTVAATDQTNVGGATGVGAGGAGTGAGVGVVGDGTGTGTGGAGTGSGTNNQSNTANTSANGSQSANINFSPDCSVTNVTQQSASAPAGAAARGGRGGSREHVHQVNAPLGAVHAGAGAAAAPSAATLFGLAGSLGTTGLGLLFRKK